MTERDWQPQFDQMVELGAIDEFHRQLKHIEGLPVEQMPLDRLARLRKAFGVPVNAVVDGVAFPLKSTDPLKPSSRIKAYEKLVERVIMRSKLAYDHSYRLDIRSRKVVDKSRALIQVDGQNGFHVINLNFLDDKDPFMSGTQVTIVPYQTDRVNIPMAAGILSMPKPVREVLNDTNMLGFMIRIDTPEDVTSITPSNVSFSALAPMKLPYGISINAEPVDFSTDSTNLLIKRVQSFIKANHIQTFYFAHAHTPAQTS